MYSRKERFQVLFLSHTAPGAQLWFLPLLWAAFLVGGAICTFPGQQGRSWQLLVDFLVEGVICTLPGQQGGFWHPLADFLVARGFHVLRGQWEQVLRPAGRVSSNWICLRPSGSARVGSDVCLGVWKSWSVPASGDQDGGGDSHPPPEFL